MLSINIIQLCLEERRNIRGFVGDEGKVLRKRILQSLHFSLSQQLARNRFTATREINPS
jgi:hypothetical protein